MIYLSPKNADRRTAPKKGSDDLLASAEDEKNEPTHDEDGDGQREDDGPTLGGVEDEAGYVDTDKAGSCPCHVHETFTKKVDWG